jgi:hypothetical protein
MGSIKERSIVPGVFDPTGHGIWILAAVRDSRQKILAELAEFSGILCK